MSDPQSQASAYYQAPRALEGKLQRADWLAQYVRDEAKARELAARYPGTEITVNGIYAHVEAPKRGLFGLGFLSL